MSAAPTRALPPKTGVGEREVVEGAAPSPSTAEPFTADQLAALFPPRKVPTQPTLILSGGEVRAYPTLSHLALAIAERLGGRPPVLVRSMATLPGMDTFPAFSVHAEHPPGAAQRGGGVGPRTTTWIGAAAIQDTAPEHLDAAILAAQSRHGAAA